MARWTRTFLGIGLLLFPFGCASRPDLRARAYPEEAQASLANKITRALDVSDREWPEARDRLVCDATPVLRILNGASIGPSDLPRVKDLISGALLNVVPYDEFRVQYPVLHRLISGEIEARRKMAAAIPRRNSVGSAGPAPEDIPCMLMPDHCVPAPREKAHREFRKYPGLSVPAVIDLLRDETPATRVEGLILAKLLRAVTTLQTVALLQNDSSEVPVLHDAGLALEVGVGDLASKLWPLAVAFARWHPPLRAADDFTERQMTGAVLEFCRSATAPGHRAIPLLDDSNRLIRESYDGFALFWSDGPNQRPGDSDDVIRYLDDCRSLTTNPADFVWTAAGGGATALPPKSKSVCEAEKPR